MSGSPSSREPRNRSGDGPPGVANQTVFWVICWALLTGLWLWLVGMVEASELGAGAAGAAVSATLVTVVRSQRQAPFRPGLRWVLGMWRLPLRAVLDTGILVAALWRKLVLRRPVEGAFRAVSFRATGEDPESIAARAVTTGAASFGPNTYVLDVNRERGLILVHQLSPEPGGRESVDPLGLG